MFSWSCTSSLPKMYPNRSSECRFEFSGGNLYVNFGRFLKTVYTIPMHAKKKSTVTKHCKSTLRKLQMWVGSNDLGHGIRPSRAIGHVCLLKLHIPSCSWLSHGPSLWSHAVYPSVKIKYRLFVWLID